MKIATSAIVVILCSSLSSRTSCPPGRQSVVSNTGKLRKHSSLCRHPRRWSRLHLAGQKSEQQRCDPGALLDHLAVVLGDRVKLKEVDFIKAAIQSAVLLDQAGCARAKSETVQMAGAALCFKNRPPSLP